MYCARLDVHQPVVQDNTDFLVGEILPSHWLLFPNLLRMCSNASERRISKREMSVSSGKTGQRQVQRVQALEQREHPQGAGHALPVLPERTCCSGRFSATRRQKEPVRGENVWRRVALVEAREADACGQDGTAPRSAAARAAPC